MAQAITAISTMPLRLHIKDPLFPSRCVSHLPSQLLQLLSLLQGVGLPYIYTCLYINTNISSIRATNIPKQPVQILWLKLQFD